MKDSVTYGASTSAGSAMVTAAMLDRGREALDLFKDMTAKNPRNIHWQNLRPGSGKPLLPHIEMYRRALEEFLVPEDLQRLSGKQLEFLMAKFPRWAAVPVGYSSRARWRQWTAG